MSKKRKSAADYRIDHKAALNELKSIESKIRERLFDLAKANPEVPITTAVNGDTIYKAKSLVNKFYIETLPLETQFYFIDVIEKFNASLIGSQLSIEFTEA